MNFRPSLQFYRHLLVFFFTLEEINKNLQFLPNISLGYQIFDSCANVHKSVYSTFRIMSGGRQIIPNYSCWNQRKMVGFIGEVTAASSYVISQLAGIYRICYSVYTAVYAMAHSLHDMYATSKSNNLLTSFAPWRAPPSLCNEACEPGYRMAKREGEPPCCYDCVQCTKGEMSNTTDSRSCWKCSRFENSNINRTGCAPKDVDFLSYGETLGGTLTIVSLLFSIVTSVILGIFWTYRETSIVKANNRKLSYVLLISITLCFMCTLLFIGRPSPIRCLLRQAAFGVVFTVSVSSVLAKTLTVIMAFKATRPGSRMKRLLGMRLPDTLVVLCSMGEVLLSVIWIMLYPPYLDADTETDTILLLCNEGSSTFFFLEIGYIGMLALICLGAAFLAKDFPDRFNEAKNISFSILVFSSVWVTFVPTYLSVKGKNMVAVEVFAILTSSAGLLSFIFFPKCYVIFIMSSLFQSSL
ncbi:vomeronasal type-2 receptor 26-like [Hyla sarda]|uniref:vomeronasal type-2 receptor 26-like n=1 Tax=Hyla sarda TaxID=327740 RepID=UPI0024C472C5|nr:vomeronasal type-2 receptor 26-like [Hyla sarda]